MTKQRFAAFAPVLAVVAMVTLSGPAAAGALNGTAKDGLSIPTETRDSDVRSALTDNGTAKDGFSIPTETRDADLRSALFPNGTAKDGVAVPD